MKKETNKTTEEQPVEATVEQLKAYAYDLTVERDRLGMILQQVQAKLREKTSPAIN